MRGGFDHDEIGTLGQVEQGLAHALTTVRRILLVGLAITLEGAVDGVAEGSEEGGRILRRVGHDRHVGESLAVQGVTDDGDLAVHHSRRGHHVRSGAGLGHRHRGVERQGGVVVDVAVRSQRTTMAMIGELIQTGVGTDDEVVTNSLAHRRDTGIEDSVGVPGMGTDLVLVLGNTEQVDTADAGLGGLGGEFLDGLDGVLVLARQTCDLDRGVDALLDEDRQHELGRGDPGLRDHASHRRGGAQPARTRHRTKPLGQRLDAGHARIAGIRQVQVHDHLPS